MEADHDNLRAALAWALTRDGSKALQLAADLGRTGGAGTALRAGSWLTAALASGTRRRPARGRALVAAAILAYDQGDGRRRRRAGDRGG